MAISDQVSSFFQDDLDQAIIDYDGSLERDVHGLLKKSSFTVSVAESLTGGLLAERLTFLPGSSSYFVGGIICYHPRIKQDFCGVSSQTIKEKGIVSEETALEMVKGLKKSMKTSICISTTGYASPHATIPNDQVGHVFIGFLLGKQHKVDSYRFEGSRDAVRQKTIQTALMTLKNWLLNQGI